MFLDMHGAIKAKSKSPQCIFQTKSAKKEKYGRKILTVRRIEVTDDFIRKCERDHQFIQDGAGRIKNFNIRREESQEMDSTLHQSQTPFGKTSSCNLLASTDARENQSFGKNHTNGASRK